MTGLSVNILTERLDDVESCEFAPVTSRNLLEGILNVKRMDCFGSADESDGDGDTVTDGGATARDCLVALVLLLESGVLG